MASGMAKSLVSFRNSSLFSKLSSEFFSQTSKSSTVQIRPWSDAGTRRFSKVRTRRGGGGGVSAVASAKGEAGGVVAAELEEKEDDEEEWRSRNQSKRDSKRAREWGLQLAALAPAQIKQAVRWAGLSDDLYDAVMIVKNLGTSSRVRNGRRRQYNYIGGLLRDVDPTVMEPVLKATRDGDVEGVIINSPVPFEESDEEKTGSWEEEEEDDAPKLLAEDWLHGLVRSVPTVEEEVYSMYDVDYDRQELRKLVRNAQKSSTADSSGAPEPSNGESNDSTVATPMGRNTRKSLDKLRQFLVNIARQRVDNKF